MSKISVGENFLYSVAMKNGFYLSNCNFVVKTTGSWAKELQVAYGRPVCLVSFYAVYNKLEKLGLFSHPIKTAESESHLNFSTDGIIVFTNLILSPTLTASLVIITYINHPIL